MAASQECPGCCENFNKSTRKPLQCPYCKKFEMCRSCFQNTIIYSDDKPACPACKQYWTNDVLRTFFTKKFITSTIDKKLRKNLQDLEDSLLPESQNVVAAYKNLKVLTQKTNRSTSAKLAAVNRKLKVLNIDNIDWCQEHSQKKFYDHPLAKEWLETGQSIYLIRRVSRYGNTQKENLSDEVIEASYDLITQYNTLMKAQTNGHVMTQTLYHIERSGSMEDDELSMYKETETKGSSTFVRSCNTSNCNGFINNQHICTLCDTEYCKKCEEALKEGHICNDDELASVKLKNKNSKPCPNPDCKVPIFKISGCDQMWCTKCYTTFSWNRGTIIHSKMIHNPHYLQHQRSKNKALIDHDEGPCGRPAVSKISIQLFTKKKLSVTERKVNTFVIELHRILGEILDGSLPNRFTFHSYTHESLASLRFKVLTKRLDKSILSKEALAIQYRHECGIRIKENLFMFCNGSIDILRNMVGASNSDYKIQYKALYNLCCLFNQNLRDCMNLYKYKEVPCIIWVKGYNAYRLEFCTWNIPTIIDSKDGKDRRSLIEHEVTFKEIVMGL